jgi:hypothetical protein
MVEYRDGLKATGAQKKKRGSFPLKEVVQGR